MRISFKPESFKPCDSNPFAGQVGQEFKRHLGADPLAKGEYDKLVGHKSKQAFRNKWAESRLEEAKREATKTESHSLEESVQGVYLPFRRLWDMEGADMAGFQAHLTIHTCTTCRYNMFP